MFSASFRQKYSLSESTFDRAKRDSVSGANSPAQWPSFQPTGQSKPTRVIRFSRFIMVAIILLVLLAVTVGVAYSYSVQLQDYNRLQSQFKDLASQNLAL